MAELDNIEYFIDVPTWDNGVWTSTKFSTRDEFKSFVLKLFKEPGKYDFDETAELFNEQAKKFNKTKLYTEAPVNSQDYIKYWGALRNEHVLSEKVNVEMA